MFDLVCCRLVSGLHLFGCALLLFVTFVVDYDRLLFLCLAVVDVVCCSWRCLFPFVNCCVCCLSLMFVALLFVVNVVCCWCGSLVLLVVCHCLLMVSVRQ